ncbi:acyl-CoA dehydrogenase [Sphingobium fuliginis]|uniref:acyl-CoA dehydrogenase n=1 Tax=Sphingobium fuliginis (strain ATCC 27551) TaxID=336203 RepID=UPI001FCA6462|nr:acyl-CoA dehydrogenase [Sphingobium fuliginis]
MAFRAPIDEQLFLLTTAGISGGGSDRDTVEAVLRGIAVLAETRWGPLSRIGDAVGAKLSGAGVIMPPGYREAYANYVEGGWGSIGVPVEFGGQGLSFSLSMAVLETLGGANMAFALCPLLTAGAIEALHHHGSPTQKAIYLPKLATGEWTGTMNLTEPQAGSDVGMLRTQATPRADGRWNIQGMKTFISFGDHDLSGNIAHLVLARTPGAPPGTRGISLFLVPKLLPDANGEPAGPNDIRVVSIEHKLGIHASPTCVMSFGDQDCCIGELVGEEFGGMRAMFTMMNNARLNVGLQGVQLAEAATQKAVEYAGERVQSARAGGSREPVAIIEHPDVRRMILRMKAQTQAIRALVYYASSLVDMKRAGDPTAASRLDLLTPLAKAHATEVGCEVTSLGIQVHGGMGYIEETGAAQLFRDARITTIYEGTNGIQAADLVYRKVPMEGGRVLSDLLAEMRQDTNTPALIQLVDECDRLAAQFNRADVDDRLAGSTPFLTMLSVAVCGWLLANQLRALDDGFNPALATVKRAAIRFYLEQIVPEALGLAAAASASAEVLYEVTAHELAL